MNRCIVALCCLVFSSQLLAVDAHLSDNLQRKPNLIWIMADDLGYGDLGCYGQKIIATPNLDRMASEGLRLTHFYAGATVCAPSRSVLMLAPRAYASSRQRWTEKPNGSSLEIRGCNRCQSPSAGRLSYGIDRQVGTRGCRTG